MMKSFCTWNFLFILLAVVLVNAAAVPVLYFCCSWGLGQPALPPARRFLGHALGPISDAILKPHVAFARYVPISSLLILLVEAIGIYGTTKLLWNALCKQD